MGTESLNIRQRRTEILAVCFRVMPSIALAGLQARKLRRPTLTWKKASKIQGRHSTPPCLTDNHLRLCADGTLFSEINVGMS